MRITKRIEFLENITRYSSPRIVRCAAALLFIIVLSSCVFVDSDKTSTLPIIPNIPPKVEPTQPMTKSTPLSESSPMTSTEIQDPVPSIPLLRGINLGNALEAPTDEDWGVTIQEAYFQTIREAGFNAVRVPVRFSDYTSPAPDYLIEETFFVIVDEVIRWGLENDLIVILDLHHFDAFKEDPEGELDRFIAIWEQISIRYRELPPELFFELLSEPSINISSKIWNNAIEASIATIRNTNPDRKILVGGINFSEVDSLALLELPEDKNLIATFHYYEPFEFTHQGASWVSGSTAWLGTLWENTLDEQSEITLAFDQAAAWSYLHETPVIMGEFGVIVKADPISRQAWMQFVFQEAERCEIGWIIWEFSSDFGVYNTQTNTWDITVLPLLTGTSSE